MRRYLAVFFTIIILILNINNTVIADKNKKTLIIIVDKLDFFLAKEIYNDKNMSIGLMNIKTGNIYKNNSQESFFTTISTGRRVKVEKGLFKGITKKSKGLYIKGYDDIFSFSWEIDIFGQFFKKQKIKVGYIGKDPSAIIAADKNGFIEYGENKVIYNLSWLESEIENIYKKVDILILSYKFKEENKRIRILNNLLKNIDYQYLLIFPQDIKGDINKRWNTTLVPLLYKLPYSKKGILTSGTTKRVGVITNLDIFPTIASIYNIDNSMFIGNPIEVIDNKKAFNISKDNLIEFLNLNIIKYIIHGIIILSQFYIILKWNSKDKKKIRNLKTVSTSISAGIFISLILGLLDIHKSIILYVLIFLLSSITVSFIFLKKEIKVVMLLCIGTSFMILFGIFIYKPIIYDSYIGYNNIVAGGRFYGLNNEIMGVLLSTSIIGYFSLREKIENSIIKNSILFLYFPLVILSLSNRYGANFGGFLGAITAFLMIIYIIIFGAKLEEKNFLLLASIGVVIFLFNIYFDVNNAEKTHIGNLIERINLNGLNEFVTVFISKIKQFMFMIVIPPWSIIFLGQLYFIIKIYKSEKGLLFKIKDIYPEIMKGMYVVFITSVVVLFMNDTGVISFVYMNTYLISIIINLLN
ncbi:hypothetical protein [Thermohalobacter berrensis]|uniref:Uncharacterized protein n=1 Tax=Thermohalobacter berrensis TaxID=99594 RepID=A0A419T190_9FIRM|nr:hypothetical protein [Thermohalobacter berrensis]RKD31216.1 hypothetical protein BET03_03555 [Thermohalobacter berrensis]